MRYLEGKSNYNKYPHSKIKGFDDAAFAGYESITEEIKSKTGGNAIVTVDCYVGVDEEEVLHTFIKGLNPKQVIKSEQIFYDSDKIETLMKRNLTDDRVFGIAYYGKLQDFVDPERLEEAKKSAASQEGLTLIYGVGAGLIHQGDLLVYADMTCWEVQLRYRKGLANFKADNKNDDTIRKYKRGYFIDWRICDRHKEEMFDKMDYVLDSVVPNEPKMVTGAAFREGLAQVVTQPFRTIPFFDPGVWGGQWMKEVFDIEDKSKENYAWSYNCLMNENSIGLNYNGVILTVPAMDLVYMYPKQLIGEKGYARFGSEYPIRFDFLDTMDGGNLSLQVHPTTQFIRQNFAMQYTQDESYYILESGEGGCVYLGLKENVDKDEFISELKKAGKGGAEFDVEKYVNRWDAKKHDHFLIPAGTIHCSSKNTMVLEISSSPCIFTFKLWDWGRIGMDGIPRPTHIDFGEKVMRWDRTTKWIEDSCVNNFQVVKNKDGILEERTGLHELQFIETRRILFKEKLFYETNNETQVINLIEGKEAIVESPNGLFEPFIVHFAETFVIPASVSEYTIKPHGESAGKEVGIVIAYVRF